MTVPAKKKTVPQTKQPKRANLFFSNLRSVEKSLPSLRMTDSILSSDERDTQKVASRKSSPLLNNSYL